jgi:hypothetical protein
MAAVYLQQIFGDDFTKLDLPFVAGMDAKAWLTLKTMIETKTNCPQTSSMGRLFDAVSSCVVCAMQPTTRARLQLSWNRLLTVIAGKDISLKFPVMGVSYAPRMLFARP